jgi:Ca2+-binding EF-hand superfamily protein
LSKEHGVSVTQLDRIKSRFDQFDLDGSGNIDYDEFVHLLMFVLKAKRLDDISESTASRFWKEIDIDGSGEVDFEEFTAWYVKYFGNDDAMDLSKGPVHAFYDSFIPVKKRV